VPAGVARYSTPSPNQPNRVQPRRRLKKKPGSNESPPLSQNLGAQPEADTNTAKTSKRKRLKNKQCEQPGLFDHPGD
jgi:hypothetical protein